MVYLDDIDMYGTKRDNGDNRENSESKKLRTDNEHQHHINENQIEDKNEDEAMSNSQ